MTVFADLYSRCYQLLYRDKDYSAEVAYVDGLLQGAGVLPGPLLELGSGTGGHAVGLSERGWAVHGVELSPGMLQAARRVEAPPRVVFEQGDARTVRVGRRFGAVVSLFHVVSYQTTPEDLEAMLATVREHLHPGGLFLFDCWYGPGVLSDPPVTRVRRCEGDGREVVRVAEPRLLPSLDCVDVCYDLLLLDPVARTFERAQEVHRMRYFFLPALRALLEASGFTLEFGHEWMTRSEPGERTWYLCVGARLR